jgi:hypothetical protein
MPGRIHRLPSQNTKLHPPSVPTLRAAVSTMVRSAPIAQWSGREAAEDCDFLRPLGRLGAMVSALRSYVRAGVGYGDMGSCASIGATIVAATANKLWPTSGGHSEPVRAMSQP